MWKNFKKVFQKLLFIILWGFCFGVFFAPALVKYESQKHFFCDYLGVPAFDKGKNHSNQTFDRMFSYRQFSDGHYQAQFRIAGDWIPVQHKQNTIYYSYFDSAGRSFNLHRFNLKTAILVDSYIYHLSPENYKKALSDRKTNPYIIPYDDKALPFFSHPLPKNHIKKSFDKSHYQCHKVQGLKYILKKAEVLLLQLLSAS